MEWENLNGMYSLFIIKYIQDGKKYIGEYLNGLKDGYGEMYYPGKYKLYTLQMEDAIKVNGNQVKCMVNVYTLIQQDNNQFNFMMIKI